MDWHCLRHGVYREAAFVVWMETYVCHGHGELEMMNELEGPERAPLSSKWNRSTPRSRQVVPLDTMEMPNAKCHRHDVDGAGGGGRAVVGGLTRGKLFWREMMSTRLQNLHVAATLHVAVMAQFS